MYFAHIIDLDNTLHPAQQLYPYIERQVSAAVLEAGIDDGRGKRIIDAAKHAGFLGKIGALKLPDKERDIICRAYFALRAPSGLKTFGDEQQLRHLNNGLKFLVSAGEEEFQRSKIAVLPLEGLFDETHVVPDDKEAIFLDICKRRQLLRSRIAVLGDKCQSELRVGRKLGMVTIQMLRDGTKKGEADYYVHDLAEYVGLIRGLEVQAA